MKIAHPKTNIGKTFSAKLCFDFMVDTVTIEPGFRQQVVAKALKMSEATKTRLFGFALGALESPQGNFRSQGAPQESLHEMRNR